MSHLLRAAGVYNVVWGLLAIVMPTDMFTWFGMEQPNYPQLWQCIGMIVGVYGVGYWIAARDPMRHWPIVLVGLIGKVLGPIGFIQALAAGVFPPAFGVNILFNDLIWWAPFAVILLAAMNHESMVQRGVSTEDAPSVSAERAIESAIVHRGGTPIGTLRELSLTGPLLVVLLRHFGCTFCRESLSELAALRSKIESAGVTPVFVHMGGVAEGERYLGEHGHAGAAHVSDPDRVLYRALGLRRGTPWELFGPGVLIRGFIAGVLNRHGVGSLAGDGFQMPGVFLISAGRVVREYRHRNAASRPDYAALACPIASDRSASNAAREVQAARAGVV